ncbi:HEAT repeat domain-containing protein [Streptomyces sp. NPDC002817]|uniref:HEAT repeat domain-containing protein n=1 Tax=Streptomyces sp. NPDC088357 TaxID=3154655 RepID=UPI00343AD017
MTGGHRDVTHERTAALFPADQTPTGGVLDPAVAQALGLLGDSRAVEPLLGTLSDDHGVPHRSVVQALGHLGDRKAVDPLLAALRRVDGEAHPDDDLLLTIVQALVGIGDPRVIQTLSKLRAAEYQEVRSRVAAARATLGDSAARDTLREAMAHSLEETRREALWSLATLESDEVDRMLLSRDHDGVSPGIDPQEEIKESGLPKYATAARLPLLQVRSRYEELAERYPLRPAWRPPST